MSSPYLAQALAALQQPVQQAPAPTVDMQTLANAVKQRQTWQAANPGGNYAAHGLMEAGRNVLAAPGNVVDNLGGLFARR